MTKKRALELLRDYWGTGESVPPRVIAEIDQSDDCNLLKVVAQKAGVWSQVKHTVAFDNKAIRQIASKALADLECKRYYNRYFGE